LSSGKEKRKLLIPIQMNLERHSDQNACLLPYPHENIEENLERGGVENYSSIIDIELHLLRKNP
jgi:hypothetical protein